MKLNAVLFAQGLCFFSPAPRPAFFIPDLIKDVQARYSFVRVPTTADEVLPLAEGKPIVFHHGKFVHDKRPILVHALHLASQWVAIETTPGTTDDADIVLSDFVNWLAPGVREAPPRAYVSHLEVRLDVSLDRSYPLFAMLGDMISHKLQEYGSPVVPQSLARPVFEVSSVEMQPDPGEHFVSCAFRIERRIGQPFAAEMYFSQAPLRTADHIATLNTFEKVLTG